LGGFLVQFGIKGEIFENVILRYPTLTIFQKSTEAVMEKRASIPDGERYPLYTP
jgi:hypothetical protein